MSCLYIDDLAPASFRGMQFYVKNDRGSFGRRIVLHEYPMRDDGYNEDMGEKQPKFQATGYVFGSDWIGLKNQAAAVARMRGPALLQLPAERPMLVVCNSLEVSRSKDESGYFELNFNFTLASAGPVTFGAGMFEGLIGDLISTFVPLLTSYYDRTIIATGSLDYVIGLQESRIAQFADDAIAAVESTATTDARYASAALQGAVTMYQNTATYAQPDEQSMLDLARQPDAADVIYKLALSSGFTVTGTEGGITCVNGASAVVPIMAAIINNIGRAMEPDDVATTMLDFSVWKYKETSLADLPVQYAYSTTAANTISPSDRINSINGTAFGGIVRSLSLMKLAQAVSAKTFRTRFEAIQARANVVELFNAQIALFEEDEIVNVLLTARDYAVKSITIKMASLVNVVTISAPGSQPSLYWANRLYQDLGRAEDLIDRNDVAFPAYMPVLFEALAR
jgi:hypothetical protein